MDNLEKPRLRWEDNIKMDILEGGLRDTDLFDWIDLAKVRNCGNDTSDFIKCGEFLERLRTV